MIFFERLHGFKKEEKFLKSIQKLQHDFPQVQIVVGDNVFLEIEAQEMEIFGFDDYLSKKARREIQRREEEQGREEQDRLVRAAVSSARAEVSPPAPLPPPEPVPEERRILKDTLCVML
jgi:hypothetical protein